MYTEVWDQEVLGETPEAVKPCLEEYIQEQMSFFRTKEPLLPKAENGTHSFASHGQRYYDTSTAQKLCQAPGMTLPLTYATSHHLLKYSTRRSGQQNGMSM